MSQQTDRIRELNKRFTKLDTGVGGLFDQISSLENEVADLKQQLALAQKSKLEAQLELLEDPVIDPHMRAGCIGEFSVTVTQICPDCWSADEGDTSYCDLCDNAADEFAEYETEVDISWTIQKLIFKRMCKFKAESLK